MALSRIAPGAWGFTSPSGAAVYLLRGKGRIYLRVQGPDRIEDWGVFGGPTRLSSRLYWTIPVWGLKRWPQFPPSQTRLADALDELRARLFRTGRYRGRRRF